MKITYYTYGNIIRILSLDEDIFKNSKMIDVNTDDETILSEFDASRPFDAAFIQSYINILSQSTVEFRPTSSPSAIEKANSIINKNK